jgi:gamma-glutamyltranspeptidase/glutathione hydrolase
MDGFVFNSRRSPVLGRGGMAVTSQPLAVAAGLEILRKGGNAADAAVAMAAALNVTEPTSTGIGGDCFALFFDARLRQVSALNGSGRAPAGLTLERLQREGFGGELPEFHAYTVTVPGACAGWCDLVERSGRLSMRDVLAPAIRLAEEGFPVTPITAYFWGRGVERQLRHALGGLELTIEGRAPRPGEIFRNSGLSRTLQAVAEGGKLAFYQGDIAEAIAATVHAAGGCLTVEDLAEHQSTWEQPISTTYRGLRVWECPPNGQGLAALIGLNILEGFDLAALEPLSAERLHLEIEAMRLAFADTSWYVADPAFDPAPLDGLLSKDYAEKRRCSIDPRSASRDVRRGAPTAASDTVYLSVVDGEGNACSFINSNYMGFGTGIVPAGWGFTLQNRGLGYSLEAGHPNALAPRKRPYHTIIPGMMTRLRTPLSPGPFPLKGEGEFAGNLGIRVGKADPNTQISDFIPPSLPEEGGGENNLPPGWDQRVGEEELFASFGVMGGFMQPQGHLQVVTALVDDGLDPQTTLDQPRFCIQEGETGGKVALEEGIDPQVVAELADMGHPVERVSGYSRVIFGRGQIILRQAESDVLWGGSDPRADGCAMSL